MDIRCIIERAGGTKATIDGKEYHFKPRETGAPHLCDVKDKGHMKRFLSIPEAYELFIPDDEDDGDDPSEDELQALAAEAAAAATTTPDDEPDDEHEAIDGEAGHEAMQAVLANIETIDRATAETAFQYLLHRPASPKAKDGTVILAVVDEAGEQGFIDAEDFDALRAAAEARKAGNA